MLDNTGSPLMPHRVCQFNTVPRKHGGGNGPKQPGELLFEHRTRRLLSFAQAVTAGSRRHHLERVFVGGLAADEHFANATD
jgi:hypothetical protein